MIIQIKPSFGVVHSSPPKTKMERDTHIYMYIYIFMKIKKKRERERERERKRREEKRREEKKVTSYMRYISRFICELIRMTISIQ